LSNFYFPRDPSNSNTKKKCEGTEQDLRINQLRSLATASRLHSSFFHFQILKDIFVGCTLCIRCGNLLSTIVQTSMPTEASIPLRYLNRNISHCHLLSLSITTSTVHDAIKNLYSIYHICGGATLYIYIYIYIYIIQAAHIKHVKVRPVSVL
jgi:hypothetical protein